MNTKRYLLFIESVYEESGGLHDVVGAFDTIEDAKNFLAKREPLHERDYYSIWDAHNLTLIETSRKTSQV
jgi:hypothetical protein